MHLRWWHTASLITYALRRLHTNPSDWIKNKALPKKCFIFWRRQSDLNRWIRVLQTHGLPLGYVAVLIFLKKIGHKKLGEFCVLFFMERMTRLELATSTLARWRSTRWATSAYMVPPIGIEPMTRGFSVLCSTNWATEAKNGDPERARTVDL